MVEITIHARGGQGGVTLAKLIAEAYFLKGKYTQAFGVYAAERSGAPLQAYVRIDDEEITNANQVREPDHVIVLDRTLIGPRCVAGLKPDGWVILNTPSAPDSFQEAFPGLNVATIDATSIAVANGLGTRTVPIVNTTILGAVARVFGLTVDDARHALAELKFVGKNITAAATAFDATLTATLPGERTGAAAAGPTGPIVDLLDAEASPPPKIRTGTWASRQPHRHRLTPPCNHGCPAGNNVRDFLAEAAAGRFDEALRIIHETSPFPGICGRVCPAPCMEACNRNELDEPVNIREVERYIADQGRPGSVERPFRDTPIAVIGSGPAGLSVTYHLARLGYPVTIFESGDELGGVMRTGIPEYRLPREVLDREIQRVLEHGVRVHTGWRVDRAELLRLSHEYSAVFVGTGLQHLREMKLGDSNHEVVVQGIDFLDRVRGTRTSFEGMRVAVIGGGNTAIDAARTARRLGAQVQILYRRSRQEMPAIHEEVEEALEEGITLDELVSPIRLQHDELGPVLTCQRMRLGEPDASGRRQPVPETTEDAFFDVRCDRVVLALGQSADLSILPEGSDVSEGHALLGMTGAPVFGGGDFSTGDGTVSAAIGSGRRAAWHIHRSLTGEDLFPSAEVEVAPASRLTMHVFSRSPSRHGAMRSARTRRRNFHEVRLGLQEEGGQPAATMEAQRCFSCGVCNQCDRCMEHCPEGVLVRDGNEYRFDYDQCKGCGVCATQCPRGVIYMAEL